MNAKTSQCHVVFNPSAAASLRQALKAAGRREDVITIFDDFSFGTIDPDDAATRARWIDTELGYSNAEEIPQRNAALLSGSLAAGTAPIVWISPDVAGTMSGFLWWLSHMGDKDILILTAPSLPILPPPKIAEFFGHEAPLTDAGRAGYLSHWDRLKSENAPFRVLTENFELVSAPLEFFDLSLISLVTSEWQRMARIVGDAIGKQWETGLRQSGDVVLAARLRALAETGKIDSRGDVTDIHQGEVRLKG